MATLVLQFIPTPKFNLINALRNYSAASVMLTACVALKLLPTPMVYLNAPGHEVYYNDFVVVGS